MPAQPYANEGDSGFIGLNSRDNPVNLEQGLVSKSVNFRLHRGVAQVRKGAKRFTFSALEDEVVYGACVYVDSSGVEKFVIVVSDGLFLFDTNTLAESSKISFPAGETIDSNDGVDVYQAKGIGYVYITRGENKTTLRWDGTLNSGSIVVPSNQAHSNYPNSVHAIYYGNRHIVQIDRNTFQVSHYLDDANWSALDMFSINDGGNDSIVAMTPWTLNEFVIFMRNSIFYASVGIGAYLVGTAVDVDNSYVKSLATDIGCLAKRSIVQAGGGIIFLSDNGVYLLNPAGPAGAQGNTPEGMRLLTLSEPLSAPIDDVINRINKNFVHNSVASYHDNRYFLAVPLDDSEVNNAILIFNFLNKSWESVDIYHEDFDVHRFLIGKYENQRRLWALDSNEGLFLLDELEWDEFGAGVGTPILDDDVSKLDSEGCRLSETAYTPYAIRAELVTRSYTFKTSVDKRFSSVQSDVDFPQFGNIKIEFITTNPDSETILYDFSPQVNEDYILRLPARKIAYSSKIRYSIDSFRPSIRSTSVEAIVVGHNIHTKP